MPMPQPQTSPKSPIPDSPFLRHSRIVGSALSICFKMYEGSMGTQETTTFPSESRLARDPLDVLADMQEILLAARHRILHPENNEWRSM